MMKDDVIFIVILKLPFPYLRFKVARLDFLKVILLKFEN